MADSEVLEKLKATRMSAKRQFIRYTNNVLGMHEVMSEEELKDSFKTLTLEANKVFEANNDVEDQYAAESLLEGDALTDQQRADVEKVSSECEEKLKELKDLIVKTLWTKYGQEELSLAVEAAESEVERVGAITSNEDKEIFDFMIEHLGELVKKAKDLHIQWKSWAPAEEQQQLQTRVRELERALMRLTARKAEFIKARSKEAPLTQLNPASLSTCARGILDNHKSKKALEIVEALQSLPSVKGNQPRKVIELIQAVEKAYFDLCDLEETGAIRNTLMTKSLESKLPDAMRKDWLQYAQERNPEQGKRFDTLLFFLKSQESIYEQQIHVGDSATVKQDPQSSQAEVQANSSVPPCFICGHVKHGQKLYFCKKFQALKLKEKKDAIQKLGACRKCLTIHPESECDKSEFLCQKPECKDEQHHFYLCPRNEKPKVVTPATPKVAPKVAPKVSTATVPADNPKNYTKAQQEFVKKLPPELAKECRNVFRNPAPRPSQTSKVPNVSERGFRVWPVPKKF